MWSSTVTSTFTLFNEKPFCDEISCKDVQFKPIMFEVQRDGKALLCGCKRNHPDA
jgi:hypothetical protein